MGPPWAEEDAYAGMWSWNEAMNRNVFWICTGMLSWNEGMHWNVT